VTVVKISEKDRDGEEEVSDDEDFGSAREDDVQIKIPPETMAAPVLEVMIGKEEISTEFLADVLSNDSVMEFERIDEGKIIAIARDLEESSREAGQIEPSVLQVKQNKQGGKSIQKENKVDTEGMPMLRNVNEMGDISIVEGMSNIE